MKLHSKKGIAGYPHPFEEVKKYLQEMFGLWGNKEIQYPLGQHSGASMKKKDGSLGSVLTCTNWTRTQLKMHIACHT